MAYSAIERLTKAPKNIPTDHAYIHEGIFYEAYAKTTLATAGTTTIALTTPANKYLHQNPSRVVTNADNLTITVYEAQTYTGGTAITPVNHNRNSSNTSGATIRSSATATATGTAIQQIYIGGGTGSGSTRSGSDFGNFNEWILKPKTTYLYVITNGSTSSNTVQINFAWYEEDGT
jgi:hypothetical protein